jgi:AcrR family transcriptional regulator
VSAKHDPEAREARSEPESGDIRSRLLAAAVEVVLERGLASARVHEIARRAGLTTGAVYSHFESKTALLTEAIDGEGDVRLAELDALASALAERGLSRAERTAVVTAAFLAAPGARADLLRLQGFATAALQPEARGRVRASLEEMRKRLAAETERARHEGLLDDSITAEAFVGFAQALMLGAIVLKALGVAPPAHDELERLFRRLVAGLAPQPEGAD